MIEVTSVIVDFGSRLRRSSERATAGYGGIRISVVRSVWIRAVERSRPEGAGPDVAIRSDIGRSWHPSRSHRLQGNTWRGASRGRAGAPARERVIERKPVVGG